MRNYYGLRYIPMTDDQDDLDGDGRFYCDDTPSLDVYEFMLATGARGRRTEPQTTFRDEDSEEVAEFNEQDAILLAAASGSRTAARTARRRLSEIEARRLGGAAS